MTIYYVAPDLARPSGGVRTIYRHVDTLNDLGFEAAVVHTSEGFRCKWFENQTEIVYPPLVMSDVDVVVVPEQHTASHVNKLAPGITKVIFNQSAYRTFVPVAIGDGHVKSVYTDCPDVESVLVVSEDGRDYLSYAFPGMHVTRVHHSIDPEMFHADVANRGKEISMMPRKRPAEVSQVLGMLTNRGVLDGWKVNEVSGMTEADVARTMRRSVLWVALSRAEGFGLPPLEAMACGCYIIGFHGMGGREFFRAPYAEAIEDGNVLALARAIERFVTTYDDRADEHARIAAEASRFALGTYDKECEQRDLKCFFDDLLARRHRTGARVVVQAPALRVEARWRTEMRNRLVPVGMRILGMNR